MKPRIRIAWVTGVVALAALDFTAIRATSDFLTPTLELLRVGAAPMANVLAFGLLAGFGGLERRPFLLGFELVGAIALAAYIILASFFASETVVPFVGLFLNPMRSISGLDRSSVVMAAEHSVAVVMFTLPQLAFACLGGLLSRRYKVTINSPLMGRGGVGRPTFRQVVRQPIPAPGA